MIGVRGMAAPLLGTTLLAMGLSDRAIFALASDERVVEKTGQLVDVGTLAREYGFTDVDGTQPPPFRIPASRGE